METSFHGITSGQLALRPEPICLGKATLLPRRCHHCGDTVGVYRRGPVMSQPDRSAIRDPLPTAGNGPRPRIWVDGRQRPRFDLGAFARTSLGMAKRDLAPEMAEATQRLTRFGQQVRLGEVRLTVVWAGRAARLIPSHARVGGWLLALSALIGGAHDLLVPPAPPDEALAYPDLARTMPAPAPMAPAAAKASLEPTLHAIRSAISQTPHAEPDARAPSTPTDSLAQSDSPAPSTLARRAKAAVWALACQATLWLMLAFALPAGAIKAMLFHLDGGDLADWS
jgi:hypothetical protein